MSVPNGFDIFGHPWPPNDVPDDLTTHPLYERFLTAAQNAGFDSDSEGFEESSAAFFLFFLRGAEGVEKPTGPQP